MPEKQKDNSKKKLKILVIEDDDMTRESVMIKMKAIGLNADFAEDGVLGIARLKKDSSFTCVLLDLRMPKGNGFKFLEEKQADESLRDIPVIIFTNLSQPEFVNRALSLGARGYLVKANHSLEEIIAELKKCFETGECRIDK